MLPASAVGLAALLTLAAVRLARVGPRGDTDADPNAPESTASGQRDIGLWLHVALVAHATAQVTLDVLAMTGAGGSEWPPRLAWWALLPTAALVVAAAFVYRRAEPWARQRRATRATGPGAARAAWTEAIATWLTPVFAATSLVVAALTRPGSIPSAAPLVWLVAMAAVEVVVSARRARTRSEHVECGAAHSAARVPSTAARSELLRVEQLGALGLASGALAHEVASPLGAAISSLALAREQIDHARHEGEAAGAGTGPVTDDASAEARAPVPSMDRLGAAAAAVAEAQRDLHRVRALLETLAAVTVDTDAPAGPQRVDDAIDASLALTRALLMPRARVTVRGERGLVAVAQPGALPQVLVNLLVHAARSIPTGRSVPSRVEITTARTGAFVSIEVHDDGEGIDAKRLRGLFQLSAAPARSAAVGLAIARRVVDRHGGHMEVESVLDQGTAVRVFFPAADDATAPPRYGAGTLASEGTPGAGAVKSRTRPEACTHRPRVLLIDDEALLARTTARLLAREFDVRTATSVDDAFTSLRDGWLPDVVLCDLLLPGSSGKEVYLRLCRAHPVLADRFTFVTGGTTDPVLAAFPAQVGRPMLRKPVTPDELTDHVRAQAAHVRPAARPT